MGKGRRALVLALALLGFAAPLAAQERRLAPVDEAAADPSWGAFRERLLAALERRDREFVISILAPDVRGGLDPGRGPAEFVRQWFLDEPDSPLWRELPAALALGSAYVERDGGGRELCAPYLLGKWPRELDPRAHGVVIGREVALKAEPTAQSATLGKLSYHIVAVSDWEVADRGGVAGRHWVKVRAGAREGYLPEDRIRSAVEHAACFVRTGDGWRLRAFAPAGG